MAVIHTDLSFIHGLPLVRFDCTKIILYDNERQITDYENLSSIIGASALWLVL